MKSRLVAIGAALSACLALPAVAQSSFEMLNRTGYTITAVRAGPSNESSWGPNILSDRIATGETVVVTLDSAGYGCAWDLQYTFSDGDEFEEYEINICAINGQSYVIE